MPGEADAGSLLVQGAGDIVINSRISTNRTFAHLEFSSSAGDVVLNGQVRARKGLVLITAAQIAAVNGLLDVRGINAAGAVIEARSVVISASARLDGSSVQQPAGGFRLKATAGDLQLSGRLLARRGMIDGTATSGDVIADGVFRVAPNGCIAFSASGAVDTTGGFFDTPLSPNCIDCG